MTIASSQRRLFLELVGALRPHWRSDLALPERIRRRLAQDRRLGARDRRLYRELLYTTLRYLPWVEPLFDAEPERAAAVVAWLAADTPDTRRYRSELTLGWPPLPEGVFEKGAQLGSDPPALLPDWVRAECPAALAPDEMDALHRRAPLWLRLQPERETAVDGGAAESAARPEMEGTTKVPEALVLELRSEGWELHPSGLLPGAVEARRAEGGSDADLTTSGPYLRGAFEVQDLGSQLLLLAGGVRPGERWLDPCAGAGGKSLQLAQLVGPSGRVEAHDPRGEALLELARRRDRAGVTNLRILDRAPALPAAAPDPEVGAAPAEYDGVLVDAPCSGSGTWRRAPHLKWTTTPDDLARHAERQGRLLRDFARFVRPGGRLLYATCSLARSENDGVVGAFLAESPHFEPLPPERSFGYPMTEFGLSILPARHDTDGFYLAVLARKR